MKFFLTIGLIFCFLRAMPQQPAFTASVPKTKVTVNERFQLTFILTNSTSMKDFKPPSFKDFIVLGGPSQSSNFTNFNGQVSQSISYLYVLQPRTVGKFTIGSATVKSGDKTLSTQPIAIEVVEQPSTGQSNANSEIDINDYLAQNVFIKAEVSDNEIYKGESVDVTYKLYVNAGSQVVDETILQELQTPTNDGFYVERYDDKNVVKVYENVGGVQYRVLKFKRVHLTAQKSGNLETGDALYDGVFAVKMMRKKSKTGDPFQDMFNEMFPDQFGSSYKEVRYSVPAKSVKIKVNDLPPNAPADFNGAVGKFTMKTELNKSAIKTDEPITYKIQISGNGNLNLFEAPQLNLPPGWETYEPNITQSNTTKTFEYALIPRSPGNFTIPAHAWSYFEPAKKQYVTLTSEAYPVKVEPGPDYDPSSNQYNARKEEAEMLAQDIRYIKKHEPSFAVNKRPFFNTGLFYALLILPFISSIGLFIYKRRDKKLREDVQGMKIRQATKIANKRLEAAMHHVKSGNGRLFYDEIIKALWGYIGDKLVISQSELSKENIFDHLIKANVSEHTSNELISLLDRCELALFAPASETQSLAKVYDQTASLITKLENEIKK